MSFSDQTVSVVAGGATGIGRAVAEALSQRPGRVEIAGRSAGIDIADAAASMPGSTGWARSTMWSSPPAPRRRAAG